MFLSDLHEEYERSLPAVSEQEILSFDYPHLVDCGHDPKIGAIVHELNRRNINKGGYGYCPACQGYHTHEISKLLCLPVKT